MKKRLLSIVTTTALCLSLLSAAALAEEHICTDEEHDHWCDTCGEVVYRTDPVDSGCYACEECDAVMVAITGEYTALNYHGFEEGTLADGTAEITVCVPNYRSETPEPVENGTVTVFWTDEEGEIFENHTVENAELVYGKATVSFTNLPIEVLDHGNLLYKPADPTMYLPESNGMVLEYQDNVYQLSVDANVDCTINGVYENSLYLFAGTEVSVIPLGDFWGQLTWDYAEDSARPDHKVTGCIVTFTMPGADVSAIMEYTCETCVDEDDNHWCDFCNIRVSACADGDGDHCCDVCWEYLSALCTDGEDEAIHVCDVCLAALPDLCEDRNDDHACDVCQAQIEGLCSDEDDHYCDNEACGAMISFCEDCDWNADNLCDLCGEGIYPGAGDLNVEAEAADGSVTVTWDALEDVGSDKVASYTVFCCLENSFEPLQEAVYAPGSETYSHTFTGLENDVVYDVSVHAAYTQIRDGCEEPFSATSTDTVTGLPGAPTIRSAVYGNGSVTVEWEAPENKGCPEISSYAVVAVQRGLASGIGYGAEVKATGDPMRYTLSGLLNGQSYDIYVSAINKIGQGAAGKLSDVRIPLIPYDLSVGGVTVTEENMADVLGDGTVSYDPHTHTLTLNNARISVAEGNYGIRSKTRLTLKLIGENSIACPGVYGLHSTDDVTVIGDGTLRVTAGEVGIYIAGGSEVGGLYLKGNVTLNVTGGNAASGNSYGVRVDDVLEVRNNATLIAAAGTAPERSCAIYAYDEVKVYDDAVVTATSANQSVNLNTDCDGIRTTHVTINGGTVTATGGTAATANGIFTQTFEMNGGTLTAASGSTAGGTRFGPSTALQATRSFKMTDGVIYATSGPAANDSSCGVWVSNGQLWIGDGSLFAQSGEANFSYGIKASEVFFADGYIDAASAEGSMCSSGISVDGNLFMGGGSILAAAADADTYSYGLQAFEMTIAGGDVSASAGSAANSYGLHAFGGMEILCDTIRLKPNNAPGFIGTRVTASAEDGYAVYSRTGVEISDALAISTPEGGSIADFGSAEDFSAYYTAVDADGVAAERVEIDVLTYDVSIKGLDIGYNMAVKVPAGRSVNETYCERYGVEDFSEILPVTKNGYSFRGWRTDAGSAFTFDDDITDDVTIHAQWRRHSSGGGSSATTSQTTKNEDGSTTTTTTDRNTGAVTETTKTPDGTTVTVVTDRNGTVTEVSAKVSADAVHDAAEDGAAVKLPVGVEAAGDADEAAEIRVDVPAGGATVEIPVEDVTPGTVAVIVNGDGTMEIIKSSTVSEDGIVVILEKDASLRVIDNSRDFDDVADHFWAKGSIDFVTAREIFSGTSATTFDPNGSMTRQAMWMVLARMSGERPADMEEARVWAMENRISDGSKPTDAVTREQFVTMLWRWYGEPASEHSVAHYTDANTISDYAGEAVAWAVEHGIKGGYPDGTLKPHDTATRAHAAAFIQRFYENAVL